MDIPWAWILVIAGALALLANFGFVTLKKEHSKWLTVAVAILAILVGIGMLVIEPVAF